MKFAEPRAPHNPDEVKQEAEQELNSWPLRLSDIFSARLCEKLQAFGLQYAIIPVLRKRVHCYYSSPFYLKIKPLWNARKWLTFRVESILRN